MTKKKGLKERMAEKRKEIADRSKNGSVIFLKEGTTRIRVLPVGEDNDFSVEATHFYLGQEIKGVFSPSTLEKPCPILEKYNELKEGSAEDKDLAKTFYPKKKYLVPCLIYKDEKGKEIDEERSGKLVMIPSSIFGQILDSFLDTEFGDFTDSDTGYDIKLIRSGKGKTDTEYSIRPMPSSKVKSKKWRKEIDLNKLVEEAIPSYEEAEDKLAQFLVESGNDGGSSKPKKKKKGSKKKKGQGDV